MLQGTEGMSNAPSFSNETERLLLAWGQAASSQFLQLVGSLLAEVETSLATGQWLRTHWNMFEVLGRPRLEMAHSRAIAWLMNPREAHGLRDEFLKQFFERAHLAIPPDTIRAVVAIEKRLPSGRRVDIEVSAPGWALVVENKIDASEGKDQTSDYEEYYRDLKSRKPKGYEFYSVFLTRRGQLAGAREGFHPVSYKDVREILESIMDTRKPSGNSGLLIQHFVEHIRADLEVER
jgi:hypothetical protein